MSHENHTKRRDDDEEEEDELAVQYKVPEARPIDELVNLDKEDESLQKWKASLGLTADGPKSIGEPGDMRRMVLLQLRVDVDGRSDPVILDLTDEKAVEQFKKTPIQIKENTKYQTTVRFRIQHEIVAGINYKLVAKRAGVKFLSKSEALGSYAPSTHENPYYERQLPEGETPGGMLARGMYQCITSFTDDDGQKHLELPWQLQIVK